jgi:hypothetical protein
LLGRLGHDQRLLHESGEQVQDLCLLDVLTRPYLLRSLQSPSPREHREPLEDLPLGLGEQLVAPVEGASEGTLPASGCTDSPAQEVERAFKPL